MAEDWIQELMRDYQDAITRGVHEGICRLGDEARNTVMEEQARACVAAFVKLYDIPEHEDLDAFLARMRTGGPSKIDIRREGETILWEEQHDGECMCPLVRRNVIRLRPTLCICGAHWLRMVVERHARRPARVELLDSVASGSKNCVFRITLGAADRPQG